MESLLFLLWPLSGFLLNFLMLYHCYRYYKVRFKNLYSNIHSFKQFLQKETSHAIETSFLSAFIGPFMVVVWLIVSKCIWK